MISFSTKGSAVNEMSQKVIDATELAKQRFADEGLLDQVQIE
jgi:phosphotransacetylase